MQRVVHDIVLDLQNTRQAKPIMLKKGETGARRIAVRLVSGAVPYNAGAGVSAQLYAKKPDGTTLYNAASVEGSTVWIDLTSQITATAGTVRCALSLVDADENLLHSPEFSLTVEDCVYDGEAVESEDEFTALTTALAGVTALQSVWTNAAASAQDGETANAAVTVGEDGVSFQFTIPKGDKGDAGVSLTVGTTTTGEAGSDASVVNTGTASDPVLCFTLPRGAQGETGAQGQQGVQGATGPQGAQGVQGEKGDPGDVSTVNGVSPNAQGNVTLTPGDIGAAHADVFSRNGSDALTGKGIDVRPFADGGISIGFGTEAPDYANGVAFGGMLGSILRSEIQAISYSSFAAYASPIQQQARNNIGAQATLYTETASAAVVSAKANAALPLKRYGKVVTMSLSGVALSAAVASGVQVWTVPANWRPDAVTCAAVTLSNGQTACVRVDTAGAVSLTGASSFASGVTITGQVVWILA